MQNSMTLEMLERAKLEVHRSVVSLRDEDKVAYLEASALVPELIEKESNPAWFLCREKFDALAASTRLAKYWTERKSLFGDRAFLPIDDCSGQGALRAEEIRVLESGVLKVLPDDNHGRAVILNDFDAYSPNRSVPDMKAMRARLMFYILTRVCTLISNSRPMTDGIVFVRVFRTLKFSRDSLKKFLRLHEVVMPVELHTFHICCVSKPEVRKYFVDTVAPVIAASSAKHAARLKVHVAKTEPEMLEKLKSHGLSEHGLPPCLGGDYAAESTSHASAADSSAATSATVGRGEVKDTNGGGHFLIDNEDDNREAAVEERKARKRKNDVVYARQRRIREKDDLDSLKSQHLELRGTNAKLWRENKKLEQLFVEATTMVSTLDPSPPKAVAAPAIGATNSQQSQVEIALRALSTLRETKDCSIRDLLVNRNVRECITGVVDTDQVYARFDSVQHVGSRLPPASVARLPFQQNLASASRLCGSSSGGVLSQLTDPSPPSDMVKNLTASLYRDLQEAEYKTAMLQRLSQDNFECPTTVQTDTANGLLRRLATQKDAVMAMGSSVPRVQNSLLADFQAPSQTVPPKIPTSSLRLGGHQLVEGQNALRDALVSKILQKLSAAQRPRGM